MIPLEEFKSKFDAEISTFLKLKAHELSKIDPSGEFLINVIDEFVSNGGKRIRPALFYFATATYKRGKINTDDLKASMVFELFQTFCLIHDDLVDNSTLRRGKLAIQEKYDQNTAILTGDLALMMADELFYSQNRINAVNKIYNKFKQEVIVGEFMDAKGSRNIQQVMELKTARYSFIRPVEIALNILEINQTIINKWTKLLQKIGIIFQLKDDLAGTFSTQDVIGKSTSSDLKEGKYTQVIKLFYDKATKSESEEFHSNFGNKILSDEKCNQLRKMLIDKKIPNIIEKIIVTEINSIQEDFKNTDDGPLKEVLINVTSKIGDMAMIRFT